MGNLNILILQWKTNVTKLDEFVFDMSLIVILSIAEQSRAKQSRWDLEGRSEVGGGRKQSTLQIIKLKMRCLAIRSMKTVTVKRSVEQENKIYYKMNESNRWIIKQLRNCNEQQYCECNICHWLSLFLQYLCYSVIEFYIFIYMYVSMKLDWLFVNV